MSDRPQNPYCCGDTGCYLKVRGRSSGMGTNGGCKCLPPMNEYRYRDWVDENRTRVIKGLLWLCEEVACVDAEHRREEKP
jgi:hypothetical protein